MTMKVLQTNNEIKSARLELIKKGASHVDLPDCALLSRSSHLAMSSDDDSRFSERLINTSILSP